MSPEELRQLFAESGGLSAEEGLLTDSGLMDLNSESLQVFLRKRDLQVYEDLIQEDWTSTLFVKTWNWLDPGL
jgi:ATP-dependent DNA helicase RecG